jgi:probable rRNA maturation factor
MATRRAKPKVAVSSSQKAVRVPRKKIAELVAFVAACEGASISDVDLAVVDMQQMAALNRRYLGRTGTTDVLSFDLSEGRRPPISAQVVVCGPLAARRARRGRLGVQRELLLYVVHGLLHLMGYDDNNPPARAKMSNRQEELLAEFLSQK